MKALQEISLRKKIINQNLIVAFIMLASGFIFFAVTGFSMLIGIGVLYLIIAVLNNNLKIVKVYESYLEIKLGAIASKKFIKFENIKKFNTVNKFLEIHYHDEENKLKKVRIATKVLEEEDIEAINVILIEKTNLDASNDLVIV
ncbi:hypothetical protein [Aquimarina litoralis]|uniref:hypothetical protein n=1 Tax=Aquimarina litoralis TaxID=584605 RepID=UPI001C59C79E|nr:hypothetical protein [Aquimarina litoralis]MBW1295725.1 hypothetical protein [Aquimarina litoralis]